MVEVAQRPLAEEAQPRARRSALPRPVITLISLVVLLGLWEVLGRDVNPVFGSYPSAIAVAFWELVRSGQLGAALAESIRPFCVGYALAISSTSRRGSCRCRGPKPMFCLTVIQGNSA